MTVITIQDNLDQLVDEINQASWDDTNDMSSFDVDSLSTYLQAQDTLFVACHNIVESEKTLLGFASSRIEIKPYGKERWLYIDELDVCANHRQKRAGKAMMRKLIEIANSAKCEEVWLGCELDNHAGNALYRSLKPDDVVQVIGYTYEIVD